MADFRAELGRFLENNQVPDLWGYLMVSPDAPDSVVEDRLRERRRWAEAHTADTLYALDAVFLLVHETEIRRELARTRMAARRRGTAGIPAPAAALSASDRRNASRMRVVDAPDAPASASTQEFDDEPPTKVDYGDGPLESAAPRPVMLGPSDGGQHPWVEDAVTDVQAPPQPIRTVTRPGPAAVVPPRPAPAAVPVRPAPAAVPMRPAPAAVPMRPALAVVVPPRTTPTPAAPTTTARLSAHPAAPSAPAAPPQPQAPPAGPAPPRGPAPVSLPTLDLGGLEPLPVDAAPDDAAPPLGPVPLMPSAPPPPPQAPVPRGVWSAASSAGPLEPGDPPSSPGVGLPRPPSASFGGQPRLPTTPRVPVGSPFRPAHEEIPGVTVTPPAMATGNTRPWQPPPTPMSADLRSETDPPRPTSVARVTLASQARQRLPLSPWAVVGRVGLAMISLVVASAMLYATFHVKPPGFGGVPMEAPEDPQDP